MREAGRELNVAAARVMGCKPRLIKWSQWYPGSTEENWVCDCAGEPHGHIVDTDHYLKDYSADAACVGEMLEWAAAKGLYPSIRTGDNHDGSAVVWEARLCDSSGNAWMGEADTPQLALARALVAAAGKDADAT